MKTLAIGILTYNRKELLGDTLKSLFKFNSHDDMQVLLIDNGSSKEFQESNQKYAKQYGLKYIYTSSNLSNDINKNIEEGHHALITELLKCQADLFCILEDDWKCIGRIPIEEIDKFLVGHVDIGQVRIRDFKYDDSFYGGSSRHFITKHKIVFDERVEVKNKVFKIADMHWVNCCNVMKRDALAHMNSVFGSEYEKMQFFYELFPRNAQYEPGVFYHIGPQRIRDDLRKKGLFSDANLS